MLIRATKRPWEKKSQTRYRPDPFYQSTTWKKSREERRKGYTLIDGYPLLNIYCVECYKETGQLIEGANDDHIVAIKLGGDKLSYSNRQTLCDSHHAKKSANEGKQTTK